MKKLVSIILISVIVLSSALTVFADSKSIEEYRAEIEKYLNTGYDFLGGRGEDIYLNAREEYSRGNTLKAIAFEIKTIDLQTKLTGKTLKENKEVYLIALLPGFKKFAYILKPVF